MSGLGLGAGHSLMNKAEALVFAEFVLYMYLLFLYIC